MTKTESLRDLMHTCVEAGFLRGQKALMPDSDRIRKKDAENYLVRNGLQKSMLQKWVDNGLVEAHKGEKNSPIWFSRVQLIEMVGAIQYERCLTF